jgi:hypothetical protein
MYFHELACYSVNIEDLNYLADFDWNIREETGHHIIYENGEVVVHVAF